MELNGVVGEIGYDNLFAGTSVPVNVKGVRLKSGQGLLVRGTVLAIEAATGLAVKVDSTKTGGVESADCILTDNVDTTSSDVVSTAYSSGLFNRKALVFGGTDTADKHEKTLRTLGIYLKDNL
ncbi:head decoration protein [Bacillus sp. Au-Bac7]|uniref:head decoration protein n=1 Tax=Bacillus sp. Au-Bac7 TaxID=2906458 RepID=UPI001E5061CD|nr:head decoration protein [Bacillus sp. Au-Bac7]MCE4048031.1 head decoration protein [Bacillus sp. Au-Bac7]